jgi:hypothetical protein
MYGGEFSMAVNFNNDSAILSVTRQEREGTAIKLLLPGDLVPDGKPIAQLVKQVDATVAANWCNYVRGVLNERQESKELEESNRARVLEGNRTEEDSAVGHAGGNGKEDDKSVPPSEEEMERYLKGTVTRLLEKRDEIKSSLFDLENELAHTERALRRANLALEAYGEDAEEGL